VGAVGEDLPFPHSQLVLDLVDQHRGSRKSLGAVRARDCDG